MYALPNKTQHKLIVKVRGGISQKLDNLTSPTTSSNSLSGNSSFKAGALSSLGSKQQIIDEAGFNAELNHLPQPIFHSPQGKNGGKSKSSSQLHKSLQKQQFITPEHNEMIKFVQQTWKGVERDYKKSINKFMNTLDLNNDSSSNGHHHRQVSNHKAKNANTKKKPANSSSPLLLTGSYHHTSSSLRDSSSQSMKDSFQPFDLETFWGNRILKKLTGDI